MASALSDEELREKLQQVGENVGPITKTTRKPWEKKLEKIMQEQEKNHSDAQSSTSNLGHFSLDKGKDALSTDTSLKHRIRRRQTTGSNQPSVSSNQNDSNIEASITVKTSDSYVERTLNKNSNESNPSNYTLGLTRPPVGTSQKYNYSKLNSSDIDSSYGDPDPIRRSPRKGMQSEKRLGEDKNINSTLRTDWSNCVRKGEIFHNGNRNEKEASIANDQFGKKSSKMTISEPPLCIITSVASHHSSPDTAYNIQKLQPLDTENDYISDTVTARPQDAINEVQVSSSRNWTRNSLKRKSTPISLVRTEASNADTSLSIKKQYYEEKLKMDKEYHELRMQFQREEQKRREEEHKWKLREHKLRMEMK